MPTITDFELLKEIYRHQNGHTNGIAAIDSKLELFMQESRFHRRDIRGRLEKLEEKAAARRIDLTGTLKNGWVQLVIFLVLLASNVTAWDAARVAFGVK